VIPSANEQRLILRLDVPELMHRMRSDIAVRKIT
jgi:hypothetical protein